MEALERDIATLESQIRLMIRKQAESAESLYTIYDAEISAAGERLATMRRNLDELRALAPGQSLPQQRRAFEEITRDSLDLLWNKPAREVNQMLHRVFGGARFLVLGGYITYLRTDF